MAQISENSPELLAATLARARQMMVVSAVTTLVAIAAVVGVIGYRVFAAGGSGLGPVSDGTIMLPKGARLVSTGVSAGRVVATFEVDGSAEMRIFDVKTLRQTGRLRFTTEP